jgi:putative membrane protein
MERKLYSYITTPAMLLTIGFGLAMYLQSPLFYKTQGWMHAKLLLVILLIGFHHVCGKYVRKFEQNANTHSNKFYRWFNEIPVFFLFGIVILAVVKPF